MKRGLTIAAVTALYLVLASGTFAQTAQNPDPSKWMCRNLSESGGFVYQGETIFGSQACRPIPQASTQAQQATSPTTVASAQAQQAPASAQRAASAQAIVPAPNTVFISPMDGFETYLAAAFVKKQVPLTVVGDEAHAAYVIRGTSEEKKAGWAKMAFTGQIHSDDAASIQMIDRKTDAVVFAYAVNKKNTWHGQQTTAEACAKHLKEQMEKK